jgi:hypothetical protein
MLGLKALALGSTAVTLFIALAALTGVGLDQNLPAFHSLVAAFSLVLLPAAGLSSLLRGGSLVVAAVIWVWTLGLLSALPAYFPEKREPATRIGLRMLSTPLGEERSEGVVRVGLQLLATLGEEQPRPRRAEPLPERNDTPVETIAAASEERTEIAAPPNEKRAPNESRKTTVIGYEGAGNSMRIPVHVDGSDFGEEFGMIFDTGATLTTLNLPSLELLDIPMPPDGPTVVLHTAAGTMEAHLALVDAIWLEDEVVEWVTVAVCESCSESGAAGLLGLNVSSHFRVSMDHDTRQIEFNARRGRRNRRLDVQPWLQLSATVSQWQDGRVEVEVNAANRARRGIDSTVVEVKCGEDRFTVRLDPILPHGETTTTASLPWGSDCTTFVIRPLSARWQLDRFRE